MRAAARTARRARLAADQGSDDDASAARRRASREDRRTASLSGRSARGDRRDRDARVALEPGCRADNMKAAQRDARRSRLTRGRLRRGAQGRAARLRRAAARDARRRSARRRATGCTRSSSTATACWRASSAARRGCSPATGTTGRSVSRASRERSRACRSRARVLDGEIVVLDADGRSELPGACRTRCASGATATALFRLRPPVPRRLRPARRCRCASAKQLLRSLLPRGRERLAHALQRSRRRQRRASSSSRPASSGSKASSPSAPTAPYRSGRDARLAQGQVPRAAGVRDRRLHRAGRPRTRLGALLLGVYDEGKLRYAGKVGTGFDDALAARAAREARRRWSATSPPFVDPPRGAEARAATGSSRSWWPRSSSPSGRATATCATPRSRACARTSRRGGARREAAAATERCGSGRSAKARRKRRSRRARARRAAQALRLTHPDRVLYPEAASPSATSRCYYDAVAEWILPHVAQPSADARALPRGLGKQCFYQKHSDARRRRRGSRAVQIRESNGDASTYLDVDDAGGLRRPGADRRARNPPWGRARTTSSGPTG